MAKIIYKSINFRTVTLQLIEMCDSILMSYAEQGFTMTLRQLYYQLVARDLIPNNQKEYDRLGRIVSDARRAGLLDWDSIVDRTRNLKSLSHWNSPGEIVDAIQGGIEVALIDMMAQSWFQWQYWIEQTVRRSETRERQTHPDYAKWLAQRERELKANGWTDGYWNRPYVSEQQALEHAVQMADRFNRIFLRTLRQLRDLRRYAPVTSNNPNQVNIATDGGQQVNVSASEEDKTGKTTS